MFDCRDLNYGNSTFGFRSATAREAESYICGDMNCDGKVDNDDGNLAINHWSNSEKYPLCSEWAGDVNCDGAIDTGDATLLINHIKDPGTYRLRCCYICGDMNCDGKVNMGDAGLLHNYVGYPGQYEICSEWAGDVNCDGAIDMGDAILLQNHVTYPDDDRYLLGCCGELSIEITNPSDGETVSGIVEFEATAGGSDKLGDMYLRILSSRGKEIVHEIPLTDCVDGILYDEYKPIFYIKTCQYDWDTSGWEGEEITLTATISDVKGNEDEDSVVVYVSEEGELICGDVNCDGMMNMGDACLLHNYVSYPGQCEIWTLTNFQERKAIN